MMLEIEWNKSKVPTGPHGEIFKRVNSLDAAKKILSKRQQSNMVSAIYYDEEGEPHKIKLKKQKVHIFKQYLRRI